VVAEGHGVMDESYLTGEPFKITKTSGSTVISGAINGESALTIRTTQRAADSRYAKIMEVMRESEAKRPQLRRLGDQLGAIYTPVALAVAVLAWVISGESIRILRQLAKLERRSGCSLVCPGGDKRRDSLPSVIKPGRNSGL
jgi:cation transport ATPase